ncbi:hypothetical protein F5141DRAFT_1213083 [Pisolithus sp. B1]|nr:hypothetical protein F5141DRAFT_1213083 [Pisolithus sp. B1]
MSTPTVPSSSRVLNACNRLRGTPLYLGKPFFPTNFYWLCDGHGHFLVYVPEMRSNSITASAPSLNDGEQCNSSPDPVALSAILKSDGGYHSSNAAWRAPGIECVLSDFLHMLQNLQLLTNRCVTPGFSSGKSFFCTDHEGISRFKLHHKIFEAVNPNLDSKEPDVPPADPFTYEQWPLTKQNKRGKLLALKNSRHLPVPAYVMGHLITPTAYRRCLQGAIAEIHFTLSHWAIAAAEHDAYGGHIVFIHILVPPPPASVVEK